MDEEVVRRMQEEVDRYKASERTPPGIFIKSAGAGARDHTFLLAHAGVPIRTRSRIGIDEKDQFTLWTEFFNDETDERLYADNEAYSCPPWPPHYCGD